MIGFDVADEFKKLRKHLLQKHHVFTGEAKPNVIRLLPSLSIHRRQLDEFLAIMKNAIEELNSNPLKSNVIDLRT
jgi:acetylornithine aminotransferase